MSGAPIPPAAPPPTPTTVCNSSIKSIIRPPASIIESLMVLSLPSNSPLTPAPAIRAAISSESIFFDSNDCGTSAATICCARPSTITVFPTPASPIKTGLFFLRRDSICITLSISFSLPITGSSSPFLASSIRSTVYSFKTSSLLSSSWFTTFLPPLISLMAV